MRDNRAGECLWYEWSGDGFAVSRPSSIIYYTYDHIDIQIDVIARALASALQRDGIVVSLGDGYKAVERGYVAHGFAGEVEGEIYPTACDQEGNTNYGEIVKNPLPVTWMEII
jgi:hypothetical protein